MEKTGLPAIDIQSSVGASRFLVKSGLYKIQMLIYGREAQ